MVWLTGGGLVIGLLMVAALVAFVFWQGLVTFWPGPVVRLQTADGSVVMGEVTRTEHYAPDPTQVAGFGVEAAAAAAREMAAGDGRVRRRLVRTGNFELSGEHFRWVEDFRLAAGGEDRPEWAHVFERTAWGRFYGVPEAFVDGDSVLATEPAVIDGLLRSPPPGAAAPAVRVRTANGTTADLPLATIVRSYPANRLNMAARIGVYFSRWREFLTTIRARRTAEGGVWPAIFGTVVMTLLMSLLSCRSACWRRSTCASTRSAGLAHQRRAHRGQQPGRRAQHRLRRLRPRLLLLHRRRLDRRAVLRRTLPNPTFGKGGILVGRR
jgi:ABC-type phosphate transport system auxiliary subunit